MNSTLSPISANTIQVFGTPEDRFTVLFNDLQTMLLGLITENLDWIIGWMVIMLAIRFAPALLSWFRHRNDPKQLGSF